MAMRFFARVPSMRLGLVVVIATAVIATVACHAIDRTRPMAPEIDPASPHAIEAPFVPAPNALRMRLRTAFPEGSSEEASAEGATAEASAEASAEGATEGFVGQQDGGGRGGSGGEEPSP